MAEEYLKEVQLPSKGLFYDGQIPDGLICIEPMGTKEEKLFASGKSAGSEVINKIFDSCVTSPISHKDLVLGDRLFLLLQIRAISYGDKYSFPFRCTECGSKSWATLDIPEIPIRYADDNAGSTFTVELPILKHKLELRLLTGIDEDKVKKYSNQLNKKTKGNADDSTMIYRLARRIEAIDDEPCGIREAMELVEKLKGMDSNYLKDEIEAHDIGPEILVEPDCNSCGYENGPFIMPFDSEFFRPRRHRTGAKDHIRTAEAIDAPR